LILNVLNIFENTIVPSKQYEELRRKVFNDVKDISFYINSELAKENLKTNLPNIKTNFDHRIK
jgi:hypothetical protein